MERVEEVTLKSPLDVDTVMSLIAFHYNMAAHSGDNIVVEVWVGEGEKPCLKSKQEHESAVKRLLPTYSE